MGWPNWFILILKFISYLLGFLVVGWIFLLDYQYGRDSQSFRATRKLVYWILVISFCVGLPTLGVDEYLKYVDRNELIGHIESLKRAAEPINDVHASFRVYLPLTHHALERYRKRLESVVANVSRQEDLRRGLFIGEFDKNGGIKSVGIFVDSLFFPTSNEHPLAYSLFNGVGLKVEFYKGVQQYSQNLQEPDLIFEFSSPIDGRLRDLILDRQQAESKAGLYYDMQRMQPFVDIDSIHCPSRLWKSNGRIQSIPDLLDSLMIVRFWGFYQEGTPTGDQDIDEIRKSASVYKLDIRISGREFPFSQDDFQQYPLADGNRVYVANFSKGIR